MSRLWFRNHRIGLVGIALLLALHLLLAQLATATGILITVLLFFCSRNHRRHRNSASATIDSHKGEIGGADVAARSRHVILHPALYTDFHRGMECAIHR